MALWDEGEGENRVMSKRCKFLGYDSSCAGALSWRSEHSPGEKAKAPQKLYPQTLFCIVTENALLPWQKSLLGPAVIMSAQEN